ncbi:MAG TPA: PQQ-binding-like beta-propeller repeat protein [Pirellulales bacterium]|nr:PQQ-binding-like beta-propeller repeat protein [Pirellulales bacterium]
MTRSLGSVAIAAVFLLPGLATAADWPEFRGPQAQGHATGSGYPLTWSETEHVAWKTAIPGLGWSSPVVVGKQIWLTTGVDEGKSLRAVCVDRDSGAVLHDVEVIRLDDPGKIHRKNSHASPTPIVEGDRVYVHFGAHGTGCVSTDGKLLWSTKLEYEHRHGPGGSPVLYHDLLIVSCDGTDVQYVVALDKRTGKERWKSSREGRMAYSTPLLINVDGQDQLVSTGGDAVIAYEPATGNEIWRVRYDGYSLVPRPVVGHGMIYVCTGYDHPWLYAIRLGGKGDVTDTHVAWKLDDNVPLNPSPLLVGDQLYLVSDKGILTCRDARSGDELWRQRLGGNYSAAPVLAEGRIYIGDEDGKTFVLAPGVEYQELAINQLDGRTLATPAFVDGVIYLRSDTHLYRIENR